MAPAINGAFTGLRGVQDCCVVEPGCDVGACTVGIAKEFASGLPPGIVEDFPKLGRESFGLSGIAALRAGEASVVAGKDNRGSA